jgi:hypothetical protein
MHQLRHVQKSIFVITSNPTVFHQSKAGWPLNDLVKRSLSPFSNPIHPRLYAGAPRPFAMPARAEEASFAYGIDVPFNPEANPAIMAAA